VTLLLALQPLRLAVTVYVPEAAVVAPDIVGFWLLLEKAGPVQEYVAPATVVAVRLRLLPSQRGLLLPAVVVGMGLIATLVVAGVEVQLFSVTVTEYAPAFAAVTLVIDGF
jgi:hypothetical protein